MKKIIVGVIFIAIGFIFITSLSRCRKLNIETSTTSDLNIYPYLQTNASQFSEWAKIIDNQGMQGF